ncbi:MAG TPA: gamma-glutamyl-gamma-aminobutyrate hydrolase family protein [Actinomycetota bacterium]
MRPVFRSPPVIAVAGLRLGPGGVSGWSGGAAAVPERYLLALHRAGADESVLFPRALDEGGAARLLSRAHGLLLLGGGDIGPAEYGGSPRDEIYEVDPVRDAFEIALVREALDRGTPVLAVCRGMQLVNVALGGTLDPHLPDHDGLEAHREPGSRAHVMHPVRLQPGSRVAEAMGTAMPDCSSSHHQAVEKLGEGVVATGWASDGVVEALEHEDGWVVGVQWHPEATAARDPVQQALFAALVERAEANA